MTLRRSAMVLATVLAATTIWAQSNSATAPANPRAVYAKSNAAGIAAQTRAEGAAHQRMEEMGNTLTKMHALLKQMQAKIAATSPKDQAAKANLEMWGLMLGDLDKQYEQLRLATLAREDMEARRAAMYKQADAKVAAAQAARTASAASQSVTPAAGSTSPAEPAAATAPATAPAAPQATPSSSSPN